MRGEQLRFHGGKFGFMVAHQGDHVGSAPLTEAIGRLKTVRPDGSPAQTPGRLESASATKNKTGNYLVFFGFSMTVSGLMPRAINSAPARVRFKSNIGRVKLTQRFQYRIASFFLPCRSR